MSANDGGPAFPVELHDEVYSGMSLRDWFAGQALVGMISALSTGAFDNPDKAGVWSYEIADAMLAARAASGKEPRS